MNSRAAKKIRRETKRQVASQFIEIMDVITVLPWRTRLGLAIKLIRGKAT